MNQIKRLSEINRKKVMIRWDSTKNKLDNYLKKIKNTKDYRKYKARLLGFIAGDGNINIRSEKTRPSSIHHDVSFYPDHDSMILPFIEAFKYLYLKEPTIKRKQNYYTIRVSSQGACLDLIKHGELTTHKWQIPFSFLTEKESKVEWLRAFFDCESYVCKDRIAIQSVNKKGIEQIKRLLKEFGIESKQYAYERKGKNWSTNHILCILKKESRRRFLNEIGFNNVIKLERLRSNL